VKQWTLLQVADDEFYLDDGERHDCEYSEIKVMRVADHERTVAGLKEELEVFRNREYGFENELELKQIIARQARVIEKLSEHKKSSFFTKEQSEKWAEESLDDATENDY